MSIEDAINAIQTIGAGITGISAPQWQDYPASLTTSMLPIALTWPVDHRVTPFDGDIINITIDVAFEAIARGSFDAVRSNLLGIMDDYAAALRPYLENDPSVTLQLVADPITDIVPGSPMQMSGLLPNPESGAALQYPAREYWGFRITGLQLQVNTDGVNC